MNTGEVGPLRGGVTSSTGLTGSGSSSETCEVSTHHHGNTILLHNQNNYFK